MHLDSDFNSDMECNEGSSNANINHNSSAAGIYMCNIIQCNIFIITKHNIHLFILYLKGSSKEFLTLNENEEEDETVKAIIRSKELHRTHPPTITLDDFIVDICFHPQNDMIAVANILGDVIL